MQAVRLIALPFAGGGHHSYFALSQRLRPPIALLALDLPGRGARMREPLRRSMPDMAPDVLRQMAPSIEAGPYALFGHSMGAVLALVVARRIRAAGLPPPVCLIASSAPAPCRRLEGRTHRLPDETLIAEIESLGGAPRGMLDDERVRELFLPILRADLEAIETYEHADEPPLSIPLAVFVGRSDQELIRESALDWSRETTGPFEVHEFEGGHFFVLEAPDEVADRIRDVLARRCGP